MINIFHMFIIPPGNIINYNNTTSRLLYAHMLFDATEKVQSYVPS